MNKLFSLSDDSLRPWVKALPETEEKINFENTRLHKTLGLGLQHQAGFMGYSTLDVVPQEIKAFQDIISEPGWTSVLNSGRKKTPAITSITAESLEPGKETNWEDDLPNSENDVSIIDKVSPNPRGIPTPSKWRRQQHEVRVKSAAFLPRFERSEVSENPSISSPEGNSSPSPSSLYLRHSNMASNTSPIQLFSEGSPKRAIVSNSDNSLITQISEIKLPVALGSPPKKSGNIENQTEKKNATINSSVSDFLQTLPSAMFQTSKINRNKQIIDILLAGEPPEVSKVKAQKGFSRSVGKLKQFKKGMSDGLDEASTAFSVTTTTTQVFLKRTLIKYLHTSLAHTTSLAHANRTLNQMRPVSVRSPSSLSTDKMFLGSTVVHERPVTAQTVLNSSLSEFDASQSQVRPKKYKVYKPR